VIENSIAQLSASKQKAKGVMELAIYQKGKRIVVPLPV
jgi:hypothetical protein